MAAWLRARERERYERERDTQETRAALYECRFRDISQADA